jgi:hypothetical protein
MYRLKVKQGNRWKLGIRLYNTYEDAIIRQTELAKVGITSRVVDKIGGNL